MSTDEIEYAFEQMTRLRRPAEAELKRLERRATQGVSGPVAWVAIVPLRRSRDHVPADPDAIKEAMTRGSEWVRCFGKTAKPGCYRHKDYIPFLRGLRICIDQYNILSELHRDGTVLFRMPAWLCENGPGRPCDDPKDVKLLRLYGAWAGGLCAFRDLASQFGFPSVAIAGAGCIGFKGCKFFPVNDWHSSMNLTLDSVAFDPILLSEAWDPKEIVAIWAGELANWLGESKPFSYSPFVE
jgi:hypothetical protein